MTPDEQSVTLLLNMAWSKYGNEWKYMVSEVTAFLQALRDVHVMGTVHTFWAVCDLVAQGLKCENSRN
jgi:hypothetical protein